MLPRLRPRLFGNDKRRLLLEPSAEGRTRYSSRHADIWLPIPIVNIQNGYIVPPRPRNEEIEP